MRSVKSAGFEAFVRDIGGILTRVKGRSNEWPCLEIALTFFRKAFFSDGLDQLLSHITVLEALFGDVKETAGVRAVLLRRLQAVLGDTNKQKKWVRKTFDELYVFRSDLVHGKGALINQQVYDSHLREARTMARRSLIWFLHCLDNVVGSVDKEDATSELFTRDDILAVVDMETADRKRIARLIELFPEEFPHIPDWDLDDRRLLRELDALIEQVELSLRKAVETALGGDTSHVPKHVLQRVDERIARAAKESGALGTEHYQMLAGRLEYFDLWELQETIASEASWPQFEPRFAKEEGLKTKFDQLTDLRSAIRQSLSVSDITRKEGEAAILWFDQVLDK